MDEPKKDENAKEPKQNEAKIKKISNLYYSRADVQKAIYGFSRGREICPKYLDIFGKRPDSFQYLGDVFEMAKKGATSFHCSEEIWKEPMKIITGMTREQADELRQGWDLIIDIDSKYIDYSKLCAELIINFLKFRGIKNMGVKFSGNKGFHIIIPWKAFPKEINNLQAKNMFPEWPRSIIKYITEQIKEQLIKKISDTLDKGKYGYAAKFIKGDKKTEDFKKQVMPDIILVSPRHLFRMPYSLHEKTALASVVLSTEEISKFELKDAEPLKAEVKNFMPDCKEGEATELFREALDWAKENQIKEKSSEEKPRGKHADFKPIVLQNIQDSNFPSSIKIILNGLQDGKKRALFILINLFRSIGLEREEIEKRIYDWNKKNSPQLQEQYIKSQILWAYKKPSVLPPNYSKDFYANIGIIPTQEELRYKNPVNYIFKKSLIGKSREQKEEKGKKRRGRKKRE